jgi:hypothetical protein
MLTRRGSKGHEIVAAMSLAIVWRRVYPLPASRDINVKYTETARAVIRTRLAQAGVRLAWLLNETFNKSQTLIVP